jgi:hypothetical protein
VNIWEELDWQAIGTWFTGVALAVFAWLTWKIQKEQHNLLYSGPRIRIDYSEAIISHSKEQHSFWVHIQLVNPTGIANSIIECNWDILVPQKTGPSIRLVLPTQDVSGLKQDQLPSTAKTQFIVAPFKVDAFSSVDGWLHRCVSEDALNNQTPEKITLVFVDSTGKQYTVSVRPSLPISTIQPHSH